MVHAYILIQTEVGKAAQVATTIADIAGVTNERGNVVGLMPHPEHAVEPGFGPDTDAAMRSGVDGLRVFRSALESVLAA